MSKKLNVALCIVRCHFEERCLNTETELNFSSEVVTLDLCFENELVRLGSSFFFFCMWHTDEVTEWGKIFMKKYLGGKYYRSELVVNR